MSKRGSVVLEVALIIGMFGAIATFASLHQEVARQEAQAQYAATASAQSGAVGIGAAAEKTEGDQELCKDGERYEVHISGTESSTNAQFKETSRPNDFMVPPLKKRPCYLTFSRGDGKQITVTVPNGGKLDEAYKPASLSAASDGYSSAVDKLKSAQESGDKVKIEGALEGVQKASKEYSQALDAAYADKGNESYLKAKDVIADNNDLLSELTKNPTGITAEQVQTIQGGLSDIEAARINALGETANVGHGFNTGTIPTDLSDPLTASKIGGLADTSKVPSFSDLGTGAVSTGSTFGQLEDAKSDTLEKGAGENEKIKVWQDAQRAADAAKEYYESCSWYNVSSGCWKSSVSEAQARADELKKEVPQTKLQEAATLIDTERAMRTAEAGVIKATKKVEEVQRAQDLCGKFSCPSAAEVARANQQLVAAQDQFVKVQNKYNAVANGPGNNPGVTTGSIGQAAIQAPGSLVDTGSMVAQKVQASNEDIATNGAAYGITPGGSLKNIDTLANPKNPAGSNIANPCSQLPGTIYVNGRCVQGEIVNTKNTNGATNQCPPGTVNIGGDCKKPSASGYVDTGGGSSYTPTQQKQSPLSQLGKMLGLGGQQGGASAQGGSAAAQQACAQYPGTTLQNGQCTCPSGKGWNGSACVQSNPCAQYPGTTLQNNQCTCPTGQNWTGGKCEVPAGTNGGLKAELACAPQTQEVGKPIVISWSCENASTKRADGFTVDTANAMSGSAEVIATTTSTTGQAQNSMQFALTCIKEGQTHQAQCSVGVFRPFLILVATPAEVESGKPTRVGWITGGMRNTADACALTSPQLADLNQQGNGGTVDIPSITQETTFKLSCITQNGATKESEVTVKLK